MRESKGSLRKSRNVFEVWGWDTFTHLIEGEDSY